MCESMRQLMPRPANVPPTPPGPERQRERRVGRRQGVAIACERDVVMKAEQVSQGCRRRKIKVCVSGNNMVSNHGPSLLTFLTGPPMQCDGNQPFCGPCQRVDAECKYPIRGAALGNRHSALQQSYATLKNAIELLCTGTEEDAVGLLRQMRTAQSYENVTSLLYYYPGPWHRPPLLSEHSSLWTTDFLRLPAEKDMPQHSLSQTEKQKALPLSRWTDLSDDDVVLTHLFKLFWTWDTTLSRFIHRWMLIEAIRMPPSSEESPADEFLLQFCSSALINAILAYTLDSFAVYENDKGQLKGREFAQEAKRLLNVQPRAETIASFQAATVLSVHDQVFGDSQDKARVISESVADIQSVSAFLREHPLPSDAWRRAKVQEALSFTQIGLYQLNVKFCLVSNPSMPAGWPWRLLGAHHTPIPPSLRNTVDKVWIPYPAISHPRFSYAFESFEAEYELSRLAAECLVAIEANAATIMPDHLGAVNIYRRLLKWNEVYGERFQGPSSTVPSWVAILVFYHWACLSLLEAFICSPFLEFPTGRSANTLSQMHSEAIIFALVDYEAKFSVRHDFWLSYTCGVAVKHLMLNTTTASLYSQSLWKGCELLYKAGRFMPQANRMLFALSGLVEKKNAPVCTRVRRFLDAGTVRVRPTSICHSSYIVLSCDTLTLLPVESLVFGQSILAVKGVGMSGRT
ncbi:hypothetical protein E4U41_004337 [Claviceps citrina]|nr:hypothetical protein E4U41_004337 [Claviceps citrina]